MRHLHRERIFRTTCDKSKTESLVHHTTPESRPAGNASPLGKRYSCRDNPICAAQRATCSLGEAAMKIKLHHVNLCTTDVPAMDEFYRSVLDLEPEPTLAAVRDTRSEERRVG